MAKSCILREYVNASEIKEYPSWKMLVNNENIKNQWRKWTTFKGYTIEQVMKHLERVNKNFVVKILSLKTHGKIRQATIKFYRK